MVLKIKSVMAVAELKNTAIEYLNCSSNIEAELLIEHTAGNHLVEIKICHYCGGYGHDIGNNKYYCISVKNYRTKIGSLLR